MCRFRSCSGPWGALSSSSFSVSNSTELTKSSPTTRRTRALNSKRNLRLWVQRGAGCAQSPHRLRLTYLPYSHCCCWVSRSWRSSGRVANNVTFDRLRSNSNHCILLSINKFIKNKTLFFWTSITLPCCNSKCLCFLDFLRRLKFRIKFSTPSRLLCFGSVDRLRAHCWYQMSIKGLVVSSKWCVPTFSITLLFLSRGIRSTCRLLNMFGIRRDNEKSSLCWW